MSAEAIRLGRALFPLVGWVTVCLLALGRAGAVESPAMRRRLDRAVLGGAAVLLVGALLACAANVVWPRRFDFPPLYTAARAAWNGEAFYRPDVLARTFYEATHGVIADDWLKEVGYWYLPPSILTILPLGALPYRAALAIHYAIQWLFFCGATWLLHRLAPLRPGIHGLVETGVLLLGFGPVLHAFTLAQTLFGALFFMTLALVWTERGRAIPAGVALGLGFVYKHCLLVVGAMAFVCRRWRTGAAFVATVAAALLLALAIFGASTYRDYASFGPAHVPASSVTQDESQSLLRLAYAVSGDSPAEEGGVRSVLLYPPFVALAGLLAVSSVMLCARVAEPGAAWLQELLAIPLSLLVFPGTLRYLVGLLPPVWVLLLARADSVPGGRTRWAAALAGVYGIALLEGWGPLAAVAVTWLLMAVLVALPEPAPGLVAGDVSPAPGRRAGEAPPRGAGGTPVRKRAIRDTTLGSHPG